MTSPALRMTTRSPISTPLRRTSSALCSVASDTVDCATTTGSMNANGVTRPVRPTLTRMSRSFVVTSSGGYLNAIAHRGARDVEPSRRCSATSSTLTTTPSISCSMSWRCSPQYSVWAMTSSMPVSTTVRSETGSPQARSAS